jgi:hypothetical protein
MDRAFDGSGCIVPAQLVPVDLDITVTGPEFLVFESWAKLFSDVTAEEYDCETSRQYLLQALTEIWATNATHNHLHFGTSNIEQGCFPPTPADLFGTVKGVSPESVEDLIKVKDCIQKGHLPAVIAMSEKLTGKGSESMKIRVPEYSEVRHS